MSDIVERLRSSEPLPACPYDKLSPHYRTAPNDKPCVVCGGLNEPDAPDLCRGADTRIMGEAADAIEHLRSVLWRCRTVLGNMATENAGVLAFFSRWPINHEPLRADARGLLPVIDAAITTSQRADP